MKQIKLIKQAYGNGIAVGITGQNKAEVERQGNWFFNFGATEGDILWMSETFGFILTTEEKLISAYATQANISLRRDHSFKGKTGGIQKESYAIAKNRFETIRDETFIPHNTLTAWENYDIGNADFSDVPSKSQEVWNG